MTVSICLYGTKKFGFYCLATAGDEDTEHFGEIPELGGRRHETATEAIWSVALEMMNGGVPAFADAAIHMDSSVDGQVVAFSRLGSIPSLGSLCFVRAAYAVVVSPTEIHNYAERG